MISLRPRLAGVLASLALLAALGGCATVAPASAPAATLGNNPVDPWEAFNRKVYAFNQVVDDTLLIPVSTAYRDTVPTLVRAGVTNVFNNFSDVSSVLNHLLQGKLQHGLEMGMRVLVNTSFGLGGLLDPATEMRLERRPEDYGQTLGRWGMPAGPFLVLPFFGPTSVRDSFVVPAEFFVGPTPNSFIDSWSTRALVTTLNIIDFRANLLGTTALLDSIALDKYSFIRDAYLARRLDLVWDGAAPMETFEDEPEAAAPAPAPTAPQPK